MGNFLRKVSRTIIKDTLKKNEVPKKKGIYKAKLKQLYKVGNDVDMHSEKIAINSLALAKCLLEYSESHFSKLEQIETNSTILDGLNKLLMPLLFKDKLKIIGLYSRIEKNYPEALTIASERINFYLKEITDENISTSIVSLLLLIVENNTIYGKDILSNVNEYANIIYPLLKYIVAECNEKFIVASNLQKKIHNIENDYTKGFVLKSIVKGINDLMLDFVEHLKLDNKADHIISVSLELLTRAVEISNTYSVMDSTHKDNKDNLALLVRLSYYYVIFKEYEEKHNYLKSRIMKEFNTYFKEHPEYASDLINNEALVLLNTIVNYEYNGIGFFIDYEVKREEIVKPVFKIFFVALADLLTITRLIDTYSEQILLTNNVDTNDTISKDVYLNKLLDMLNDYRRFLCCNTDNFNNLTKLYYLTYSAERVMITKFIAELKINDLEKFVKKHGFFKKYKKNILF